MNNAEIENIISLHQQHFCGGPPEESIGERNSFAEIKRALNELESCFAIDDSECRYRTNYQLAICVEYDDLHSLGSSEHRVDSVFVLKNRYLDYVTVFDSPVTIDRKGFRQGPIAYLDLVAEETNLSEFGRRIADRLVQLDLKILYRELLSIPVDRSVNTYEKSPTLFDALFFFDLE